VNIIRARGINQAYNDALWLMNSVGQPYSTRNGGAQRAPGPVMTEYTHPTERVLFDTKRDANPYFHFMEAIWMLAGRQDIEFVSKFNSTIGQFSDDGVILRGVYGYRWRHWFGMDQLAWIIAILCHDPTTRRAVISMWDTRRDIEAVVAGTRDVPCNTSIYFSPDKDRLNMTVNNRSNDIIWGCYGANAVHLSMLHEFIALAAGFKVGTYYQFSNDWHMYDLHKHLLEERSTEYIDHYTHIEPLPLLNGTTDTAAGFLYACEKFCEWVLNPKSIVGSAFATKSSYIASVAIPMYQSWRAHKNGDYYKARQFARDIEAEDWSIACVQWLVKRWEQ